MRRRRIAHGPAAGVDNGDVDVELQVVADCPNDAPATALLRRLLDEVGASASPIRRTVVTSPQQAADLGFAGSPTILINGVDPFAVTDRNLGLSCRMYPTASGRAGLPEPAALRSAISTLLA